MFKKILKTLGSSLLALLLLVNVAFAGPTSPGASTPTTPGALCKTSATNWAFCNVLDTLGDVTNPIYSGTFTTLILGGVLTGPILNSSGTAAAPSYSFSGDTNTGIYSSAADSIGYSNGGVNSYNVTYDAVSHATIFKNPSFTQSLTDSAWIFDTVGTSSFGADLIFAIKMAGTSKLTLSATGVLGLTGSGGMSVGSGASSWPITGSGTNTTIQLTPSGTGSVRLGAAGLVIPTGSGFKFYNTADETTNTERIGMDFSSNIGRIYTIPTGSGTARVLQISAFNSSAGGGSIQLSSTAQFVNLTHSTTTLAGNLTGYTGTSTNSSGTSNNFVIIPTVSGQTGTAGYNALYINPTAAGGGSGTKNLIYAALNSVERFSLSENGNTVITQAASTSGAPTAFTVTTAANTGITASTSSPSVVLNFAATKTWATGALTSQQEISVSAPTIAFAGASTLSAASLIGFSGGPVAGANATITLSAIIANQSWGANAATDSAYYVAPPGIADGFGDKTANYGITIDNFTSTSLGNQTANLTNLANIYSGAITYVSTTNTRTVTGIIANTYIAGAPIASTNVTFGTTAYSLFVDSGPSRFDGDIEMSKGIDTTAGDSATINAMVGRFRKDTTGTTFTLTNSYITANSIIDLTYASDPGITGFDAFVVAGAGSATITFTTSGVAAAPTANTDLNFTIIN